MDKHKDTILAALRRRRVEIEMMDLEHNHEVRELAPIEAAIAAVKAWPQEAQVQRPLDFPDGPGWWAFDGRWVDGTGVNFKAVIEFTYFNAKLIPATDDSLWPLSDLVGKWTRVYMPWEEQPAPTGQPHVCVPWHPVDAIVWNGLSLHADNLAVTISEGNTTLAAFAWPQEGGYAVCKRMQSAPAMPQADWANAPAWAMWWAVDADGQSAFYGSEPCIYKLGWSINGFYGKNYVNSVLINIPLGIDWRQTPQRRPAS